MTDLPSSASSNPPVTGRRLYSGSAWERRYAYARAVVTGNRVRISGTTGYDYATDILAEGAAAQTAQIFRNAASVLAEAGGGLAHVVRVRIYIARPEDYDAVMDGYAEAFRGIDPACTTVQAGLFDPDIRVEMDMDAVLDAVA
ncbi:MAG: hypothetical protein CMO29_06805 [Tistrella sp.]|nr:Rid family hydrolase [uncultured Tistrella sp.]MAM73497.1 hypothetical protein [Tistrella sp.]|tara:strand:+ start:469 stop:897 length:429 start_codon:yes stop_codon:yes gene_type:complete